MKVAQVLEHPIKTPIAAHLYEEKMVDLKFNLNV